MNAAQSNCKQQERKLSLGGGGDGCGSRVFWKGAVNGGTPKLLGGSSSKGVRFEEAV